MTFPPRPELQRPVALDRVGTAGTVVTVEADAAECADIAARLQVPAVRSLRCRYHLRRGEAGRIAASGELDAVVERTCVVSLDEFDSPVAERFEVMFVPDAPPPGSDVPRGEEEEVDAADLDAPDEIAYTGTAIDLGEATVEQLALALDPYPRKPGAELSAAADDGTGTAFAALAAWKPR